MVNINISGNSIYWPTMRFLLAVASPVATPVQNLFSKECITHSFCNQRSIEILYNDDKKSYARITDRYLEHMNHGARWADTACKSLSHFFVPQLGKGIGRFSNAAWECQLYFNKALKKWREGHYEKSFFYLGVATHLVQDLCVPHHAMGKLLDGHQEFENWAEENRFQYIVNSGGNYNAAGNAASWVINNSLLAANLYYCVDKECTEDSYDYATGILLKQAQMTTAEFINSFLQSAIS